jgi:hypothetical protein
MDNVACNNEDISIGGSRSPSSSSQNDEIVTSMLLNTLSLSDFGNSCYELMNKMELGKFEKGSIFSDSKAKLLRQRWFSAIKTTELSSGNVSQTGDSEQNFVQCDSLIKLRCKRGKHESIEHYSVCYFYKVPQ